MLFNHLLYWYQKKIGTYDKQQWEKTVERQIFGGFMDVPMRTAKLKTELIDVDLVRGSSFPKAKPKHGLCTVIWLAMCRLLFLPLYRHWWVHETSPRTFALFLLLYSLQLFNVCTYFITVDVEEAYIVSPAEVLMPVGMMFVLCLVHSQIVSTNSGPATPSTNPRSRIRRSRYERSRSGKLRTRRNLRTSGDGKCCRENANDRANKIRNDLSPSVRFAKRVSVSDNSSGIAGVEHGMQPEAESTPCPLIEEDARVKDGSTTESTQPEELPILPANHEPADDVAAVNPANEVVVQQDDDGFESLNGNVSSDNDRMNARARDARRHEAPKDTGDEDVFEERASLARVVELDEQITRRTWRTATVSPGISKITLMDSERRGKACDSPEIPDDPIKIATPREGKQQCESEEEGECDEATVNHLTEATTSATEWMGVTSNSDVCSYSSDLEESDGHSEANSSYPDFVEHPFFWDLESPPSILLGSSCTSSDRVSCTIWTRRDIKKAELSVLDISSAIIARVESMPEDMEYFYGGLLLSLVLSLIPSMKRISDEFGGETINNRTVGSATNVVVGELSAINLETWSHHFCSLIDVAFGSTLWERSVVLTLAFEKLSLSCLLFFLLAVAERTFKQRLLYAKLFSHLTSSRRARKSDLPHFRLNKVRNIKTWLSVRSYLKRRGPQRSVDVIVSAVFIVTLLLLSFVSLELIRDLESLHCRYNVEALLWSFALGIYILRFMTLGTKIHKKYRNLSILITEQINLYLQIEQKPHKKDELMVANSVLKLAADLIKELESPFKISGLSANPYLYTITKVVLLSALSGVLSELLGFKLKLHKITIK